MIINAFINVKNYFLSKNFLNILSFSEKTQNIGDINVTTNVMISFFFLNVIFEILTSMVLQTTSATQSK